MASIGIKLSKRPLKKWLVKRIPIKVFAGVFACISSTVTIAQPSQIFTPSEQKIDLELIDIIEKSYDYHPDLLRLRAELDIIKEDISLANAAYRPQITAQGSINTSDRNSLLQNGNEFSQNTSPKELSLQLSQTLYAGGRRGLNKKVAKVSYEAAKAEYEASVLFVAEEIIDNYMSLIEAENSYQILKESVTALSELEHVITARQKAGDSSITDIAQTTARLATAKARISR